VAEAVDRWVAVAERAPQEAGVFVDFDGTLSPLVDDPRDATPHPDAPAILSRLSRGFGRVVVLSGRPVAYLSSRLGGAGLTELCGLYGLERMRGDSPGVEIDAEAEGWRSEVAGAAEEAPAGVMVERKGLTVTLHYRAVPDGADRVGELAARLATAHGLVAHPGKMSVELRPPVDVDKGTVLRDLGTGLSAVFFAGDDRGDLPAFAELARMRLAGKATLGVAAGGPETPAEVVAAADLVVAGPPGVVGVLARMAQGR
jgi:trehalose 6-phosphate phosphatase